MLYMATYTTTKRPPSTIKICPIGLCSVCSSMPTTAPQQLSTYGMHWAGHVSAVVQLTLVQLPDWQQEEHTDCQKDAQLICTCGVAGSGGGRSSNGGEAGGGGDGGIGGDSACE